ncbi:hypothetical protein OIU74_006903, partial [Salix koriyanagi]
MVKEVWQMHRRGNPIFQLTAKLKILKQKLKSNHYKTTNNISHRESQAMKHWFEAQKMLDLSTGDLERRAEERRRANTYARLRRDEEAYYKQKSKVQWLKLGDQNTSFFHRSLIQRQSRNTVHNLVDDDGNQISGGD